MSRVYVSTPPHFDWSEGQLTPRQQFPSCGLPFTCLAARERD
jgi:hypothetical protein